MNSSSHPELFTAMDEAAKAFWAYPNAEWQDQFIERWLEEHGDAWPATSTAPRPATATLI